MKLPKNIKYLSFEKLRLDKDNPRLPTYLRAEDTGERKIVNWMLRDASIIELMLAIGQAGFFPGEPLLAVKIDGEDLYTIVEGNRRLTSVLLLNDATLADYHVNKIAKILEETAERPRDIPCILFDSRSDIEKYLGYRHVTGIKTWGALAKSRYLVSLYLTMESKDLNNTCKNIAKAIGSNTPHVKRLIVGYWVYEQIVDESFFDIKGLDETSFYFNYISDSLLKENIKEFISVDLESDKPIEHLNKENLRTLTEWFFKKNDEGSSRVLGTSEQLKLLDSVLGHKDASAYFSSGAGSLKESSQLVEVSPSSFHRDLELALSSLKRAHSIIHHVDVHFDNDMAKLKEISSLARTMSLVIDGKSKDELNDV